MFDTIRKYWKRINPAYHGIIFFVIALFASNYFWAFTVSGDKNEDSLVVSFLGMDISAVFRWAILWFTNAVHCLLDFLGTGHLYVNSIIGFEDGHSMRVVAGCTAIKQFFIAFCILAFSRGPWLHKLWYIPCAIVILVGFNIFRLTVLAYVVRGCAEWFDFFHLYVMKYMFYATILVLWYIWDEYLRFW